MTVQICFILYYLKRKIAILGFFVVEMEIYEAVGVVFVFARVWFRKVQLEKKKKGNAFIYFTRY